MQKSLETVMIDVVFELSKKPSDEVTYEHHLGLEGAQHGK